MALKFEGGFRDFLGKLLGLEPKQTGEDDDSDISAIASSEESSANSLWAYRLGINVVAETLGTLLSKCEIRTYIGDKFDKTDNYYLFNVAPNSNQSAAEFKKAIVKRLITSSEHDALIVAIDNLGNRQKSFFLASDFTRNTSELYDTWFSNVALDVYGDGGIILNRTFSGDDAIYIKYSNPQLDVIFRGMRVLYEHLTQNGMKAGTYRQKYVLEMDATAQNTPGFNEAIQKLLNEDFEKFIKGENAVLPLYAGMSIDQVSAGADLGQNASTANSSVDTQVDEILSKVGAAFNIPRSIMLGDYEEGDIEHVLTFALDGIVALIEGAINHSYYGIEAYRKGIYCKFDTSNARHVDFYNLGSVANNAISSGIYTINDMRAKLHEEPADDKIGNVHFITRNYAVIGDMYLSDPGNQIVDGGQLSDVQEEEPVVPEEEGSDTE